MEEVEKFPFQSHKQVLKKLPPEKGPIKEEGKPLSPTGSDLEGATKKRESPLPPPPQSTIHVIPCKRSQGSAPLPIDTIVSNDDSIVIVPASREGSAERNEKPKLTLCPITLISHTKRENEIEKYSNFADEQIMKMKLEQEANTFMGDNLIEQESIFENNEILSYSEVTEGEEHPVGGPPQRVENSPNHPLPSQEEREDINQFRPRGSNASFYAPYVSYYQSTYGQTLHFFAGGANLPRLMGVLIQLFLLFALFVGILIEFAFKQVYLTITVLSFSLNLFALISDWNKYMSHPKRASVRKKLTFLEMFWAYLYNIDAPALWLRNINTHQANPYLPDNVTPQRTSANLGRHRSLKLIRQKSARIAAARLGEKRRFKVDFCENDVSGTRFYLRASIMGIPSVYLIDTGAEICALSESYCNILESKIGKKFVRLSHNHRIYGVGGEINKNVSQIVSLDVHLQNEKSDLFLNNLTHFVISDAPFNCLLGASALEKLECNITHRGLEAYVTFSRFPDFGELPVIRQSDDYCSLEASVATIIPPKKWMPLTFAAPQSKGRPSDWDGKNLLIEKDSQFKNFDITFSEISQMKKGEVKVGVRNDSCEPLLLPRGSNLFYASLLEMHQAVPAGAILDTLFAAAKCHFDILDVCPCLLYENSSVAYVTDCNGITQCGPPLLKLHDSSLEKETGFYKESTENLETFFICPDKYSRYSGFPGILGDILAKYKFKKNHLVILIPDNTVIDHTFQHFVNELRKYIHCDVREVNPRKFCKKCQTTNLTSLFGNDLSPCMVNVVVTANGAADEKDELLTSLLLRKKGFPVISFCLWGFLIDTIVNSAYEVTFFLHRPPGTEKHTTVRNLLVYILSDLKRLFPHSKLAVLSNPAPENDASIRKGTEEAIQATKWALDFSKAPPLVKKRKKEEIQLLADISNFECTCSLCNPIHKYRKEEKFSYLFLGEWPVFDEKEAAEYLKNAEKADQTTKELLDIFALSERPDSSEKSVQNSIISKTVESEETLPESQQNIINDVFRFADYTFKTPGVYSHVPLPRCTHVPSTIKDVFNAMKHVLAKLPRKIAIGPTLLLHFLFRPTLLLDTTQDNGVVKNDSMILKSKNPLLLLRSPRHVKGFPVPPNIAKVIETVIDQRVELGLWQRNQYTVWVSQLFAVSRNSDVKLERGKLKQLKEPTAADIRLICDLRELNLNTRDIYNSSTITNLRPLDIASFLHNSTLTSSYDIAGAFQNLLLRPSSRPLAGLVLTQKGGTLRSNVSLQGMKQAPAFFSHSLNLSMNDEARKRLLVYFDDIILRSGGESDQDTGQNGSEREKDAGRRGGESGQDTRGENHATPCAPPIFKVEKICQTCAMAHCTECKHRCPDCGIPNCDGSHEHPTANFAEKINYDEMNRLGIKFNSIPPGDKDTFRLLFEKYDPHQLLPREKIIKEYYQFPLEKGQLFDDAFSFEIPDVGVKEDPEITEKDIKDHLYNLVVLFATIQRHGSKLSLRKSKIMVREIEFFGYTFSRNTCMIPEKRLQFFKNLKGKICTVKDLFGYLGSLLYVGSHIPNAAHFCKILYKFLDRNKRQTPLPPLHKKICDYLIDQASINRPLYFPGPKTPLVLITDASALAIGATLGFYDYNKNFRVVQYFSQQIPQNLIRSLSILEKEIYGAAIFLQSNLSILQKPAPTTLVVDNRALFALMQSEELPPNSRISKAIHVLKSMPIHLHVHWRRGTSPELFLSDALSRLQYPFLPGSLRHKEIKLMLKKQPYIENLSEISVPPDIVGKDIPISDVPLLLDLYHRHHAFTQTKRDKNVTPSQVLRQFCTPSEIEQHEKQQMNVPGGHKKNVHAQQVTINTNSETQEQKGFLLTSPSYCTTDDETYAQFVLEKNLLHEKPLEKTTTLGALGIFALATHTVRHGQPEKVRAKMVSALQKNYFSLPEIIADQKSDPKYGPIYDAFIGNSQLSKKKQKQYSMSSTMALAKNMPDGTAKIILPTDSAILLLCLIHASTHASIVSMVNTLKMNFYVPNLRNLSSIVMSSCTTCLLQRTDSQRLYVPGKNMTSIGYNKTVCLDHVYMPPATRNRKTYHYCLAVFDIFSRTSHYYPLCTLESGETVRALEEHFLHHGIPEHITSDLGRTFLSDKYISYCTGKGIKVHTQLAYAPSSHSVERQNLIFTKLVGIFLTAYKTRNWLSLLPEIIAAMRALERTYTVADENGELSTIKMSAHEFLYGSPPPTPFEKIIPALFDHDLLPKEILSERAKIHKAVCEADEIERKAFEEKEEQLKRMKKKLSIGDHVLLKRNPRVKFSNQYYRDVYLVRGVNGRKITLISVFHERPTSFSVHIKHLKKLSFHSEMFSKVPKSLLLHLDPLSEPGSTLTAGSHHPLPRALKSNFSHIDPSPQAQQSKQLRHRRQSPAAKQPLLTAYDSSCDTYDSPVRSSDPPPPTNMGSPLSFATVIPPTNAAPAENENEPPGSVSSSPFYGFSTPSEQDTNDIEQILDSEEKTQNTGSLLARARSPILEALLKPIKMTQDAWGRISKIVTPRGKNIPAQAPVRKQLGSAPSKMSFLPSPRPRPPSSPRQPSPAPRRGARARRPPRRLLDEL